MPKVHIISCPQSLNIFDMHSYYKKYGYKNKNIFTYDYKKKHNNIIFNIYIKILNHKYNTHINVDFKMRFLGSRIFNDLIITNLLDYLIFYSKNSQIVFFCLKNFALFKKPNDYSAEVLETEQQKYTFYNTVVQDYKMSYKRNEISDSHYTPI